MASAHINDVVVSDPASPLIRGVPDDRAGRAAELRVEARVRAALPEADGYRVFANVAWTGRTKHHGQLSDGEADLVIAHPVRGFLVVETKAGEISRDAAGRMEESLVWRQRTFGNEVLWNGQIDDAGKSLGVAASLVPEAPSDAIICDTSAASRASSVP